MVPLLANDVIGLIINQVVGAVVVLRMKQLIRLLIRILASSSLDMALRLDVVVLRLVHADLLEAFLSGTFVFLDLVVHLSDIGSHLQEPVRLLSASTLVAFVRRFLILPVVG